MGIRVRNRQGVGVGLEKYADRSTRALRHVAEQGAHEIADVSSQMAPYKKGPLQDNVTVERVQQGRRVVYEVKHRARYAIYMHENHYNLGAKSVIKDQEGHFKVGRKYLERAVDYVLNEGGLLERARRAMRMK